MPFITLEGIDGSGKSTISLLLQNELKKRGIDFIAVREPGSTSIGEKIRELLLDPNSVISPIEEVYLYATSRAVFVREVILPAVASGKVLISERYIDSSFAYQGYGKGVPLRFIYEVNRPAVMGVFPDLTVLLDITPEVSLKRLEGKKKDRLELGGMAFYNNVRNGYLRLAEIFKDRYIVIDGGKEPEEIVSIISDRLKRIIRL